MIQTFSFFVTSSFVTVKHDTIIYIVKLDVSSQNANASEGISIIVSQHENAVKVLTRIHATRIQQESYVKESKDAINNRKVIKGFTECESSLEVIS